MELRHYYHIFADGQWEVALKDHINALKSSGLYDAIPEINVGIVGHPINRNDVVDFLDIKNIKYTIVNEENSGWEQVTLVKLRQSAEETPPHKILYAHTKGAANPSPINTYWRTDMTKEVVDKWRSATCLLEDHDAVGAFWIPKHKFFAGNFWWANSDFISRLDDPAKNSRWDAESWMRTAGEFKIFDLRPGMPFVERVPSRTHEAEYNASVVRFKCVARVLKYKPGREYVEPLSEMIEPLLRAGRDLILIDPPSIEDVYQRIQTHEELD